MSGSCWAHAATAAVESAISIYGGELQKLSSQELIECDSGNDGCNGGSANKAFEYICKNCLHKYDDYPSKKGPKTYIVGHKEISFKNDGDDENRLRHAVSRQPVTVTIVVGDEFSSYKGSHGVFRTETEFWVPHAVLVIGYGVLDGTKY
jgi:cathepsin L